MNCQVRRQRFTRIALASTAAPILRVQPLLAHSGHSHSRGSQEQQSAEDAETPQDEAEATTPSAAQNSQTEGNTASQPPSEEQSEEETPTPTAQETPASEPTTTKPLLANTTRSQNLSPVPGLGEGILALLVVGPFLLSWLKRSLPK